jgi:hypothetical protein
MAITYDQIGAQSCIRLDGDLSQPGTELGDVTRGGVDGVAFKSMGARGRPVRLSGRVDVTSLSGADTLLATYAAMKGTVVTVRLRTQSRTNYIVLEADVTERMTCTNGTGGVAGGSILVFSEWVLQYVGT